jgi:hypothetical protein
MQVGRILAATVTLLAAPAAAEPHKSFEALCLEANGDRAATERMARSMGWRTAPGDLVSQHDSGGPETVGFVDFDPALPQPDAGELVTVSHGIVTDPVGRTIDLSICTVVGRSGVSDMRTRLEPRLGVGTYGQHGDAWVYAIEDGRARSVADVVGQGEDALAEFSRRHPVHMVAVVPEGDSRVGLILSIFRTRD